MSIAMPDPVSAVLASALDGLALRQRVIADNIANVDTPNFRATSVDFESSLSAAISTGQVPAEGVAATESPTETPVGLNGNNVDLRKETLAAVQTQYQYQMLTRAVNDRFTLMRDSIGGA